MKNLTRISLLASLTLVAGSPIGSASEFATTIKPTHLADSKQYGYSQAVSVSPNARTIYGAGQVGISETGPNDFKSQLDRSFDNLLAILEASGAAAEDVVKITILIKNYDQKKLQLVIEKRKTVFETNPPTSTLIPVAALALDPIEFEIDAIAVVPVSLSN